MIFNFIHKVVNNDQFGVMSGGMVFHKRELLSEIDKREILIKGLPFRIIKYYLFKWDIEHVCSIFNQFFNEKSLACPCATHNKGSARVMELKIHVGSHDDTEW